MQVKISVGLLYRNVVDLVERPGLVIYSPQEFELWYSSLKVLIMASKIYLYGPLECFFDGCFYL